MKSAHEENKKRSYVTFDNRQEKSKPTTAESRRKQGRAKKVAE